MEKLRLVAGEKKRGLAVLRKRLAGISQVPLGRGQGLLDCLAAQVRPGAAEQSAHQLAQPLTIAGDQGPGLSQGRLRHDRSVVARRPQPDLSSGRVHWQCPKEGTGPLELEIAARCQARAKGPSPFFWDQPQQKAKEQLGTNDRSASAITRR